MSSPHDSPEIIDEADLEQLAKAGKPVPPARTYKFKVNDKFGYSQARTITGAEILTKTDFVPPSEWTLSMKVKKQWLPVALTDPVDLGQPGLEMFRANKNDAGDGAK